MKKKNDLDLKFISEKNSTIFSFNKNFKLPQDIYLDLEYFVSQINEAISILSGKSCSSNINIYSKLLTEKSILSATDIFVLINSKYNWGRLYRAKLEKGLPFYEEFSYLKLQEGCFDAIVFKGIYDNDYKILDIDGLEFMIIKLLKKPQNFKNLTTILYNKLKLTSSKIEDLSSLTYTICQRFLNAGILSAS